MTVRPATENDRAALVAMGEHFIVGTRYRDVFRAWAPSSGSFADGVDRLLTLLWALRPASQIFVADTGEELAGMIALFSGEHHITGQRYAEEICWWVEPAFRRGRVGPQLLERAEQWGRDGGLAFLKMVEPVPSDVGRFYTASGYLPIETAYVKVL